MSIARLNIHREAMRKLDVGHVRFQTWDVTWNNCTSSNSTATQPHQHAHALTRATNAVFHPRIDIVSHDVASWMAWSSLRMNPPLNIHNFSGSERPKDPDPKAVWRCRNRCKPYMATRKPTCNDHTCCPNDQSLYRSTTCPTVRPSLYHTSTMNRRTLTMVDPASMFGSADISSWHNMDTSRPTLSTIATSCRANEIIPRPLPLLTSTHNTTQLSHYDTDLLSQNLYRWWMRLQLYCAFPQGPWMAHSYFGCAAPHQPWRWSPASWSCRPEAEHQRAQRKCMTQNIQSQHWHTFTLTEIPTASSNPQQQLKETIPPYSFRAFHWPKYRNSSMVDPGDGVILNCPSPLSSKVLSSHPSALITSQPPPCPVRRISAALTLMRGKQPALACRSPPWSTLWKRQGGPHSVPSTTVPSSPKTTSHNIDRCNFTQRLTCSSYFNNFPHLQPISTHHTQQSQIDSSKKIGANLPTPNIPQLSFYLSGTQFEPCPLAKAHRTPSSPGQSSHRSNQPGSTQSSPGHDPKQSSKRTMMEPLLPIAPRAQEQRRVVSSAAMPWRLALSL